MQVEPLDARIRLDGICVVAFVMHVEVKHVSRRVGTL